MGQGTKARWRTREPSDAAGDRAEPSRDEAEGARGEAGARTGALSRLHFVDVVEGWKGLIRFGDEASGDLSGDFIGHYVGGGWTTTVKEEV